MAKLKKPFGRQIAAMKAKAIEALGDDKDKEALAKKANDIAKEGGFDYQFTADSFKAKRAKRQAAKAEAKSTALGANVQRRVNLESAIDDLQRIKQELGETTFRKLIDLAR